MNNVIKSKVTIFRNIKDFKFAPKLDENSAQKILDIVEQNVKDMVRIKIGSQDAKTISYLLANDLITTNTQYAFAHKSKQLSINMFAGEHLAITSTCDGFCDSVIKEAIAVSHDLNNKITFAFNDEYGYLMSDVRKVGSGIKVEADIMLSALVTINKIEQVQHNVVKLGYSLMPTKQPAVFTLSTMCNLGVGEKQIFEDFKNTLKRLQDLEIESVKMIEATDHDTLLDKTMRSLALVNSAHLMSFDELYNHIVNLRMGKNVGLVDIKSETLNKLQKLIRQKSNDLVSINELINLAKQAKEILKGDSNV